MPKRKLPSSIDPKVIKAAALQHEYDTFWTTISEVETTFGVVKVRRHIVALSYEVLVNDKVKHPRCGPDDAIRALSHYLHSVSYKNLKAGVK